MKKMQPLILAMAATVALSGCTGMLNRDYQAVSPHPNYPSLEEDSSVIRAETYQELVNAVLYFVSQGMELGNVHLVNYTGDVEEDLARACLEVATEDPLGAYAVDFIINSDYTRVVTTYEASISIAYRRTPEQIKSVISVTGSNAIRQALQDTLFNFSPEIAIRVGYFNEDEAYIADLVRQAYYEAPNAALGMPEVTVTLYPGSGSQRIVEITLLYAEDIAILTEKRDAMVQAAQTLTSPVKDLATAAQRVTALTAQLPASFSGGTQTGRTAWDALLGGGADSEGTALATALLCAQLDCPCVVTKGTLNGEPHFFCILSPTADTTFYADFSRGESPTLYSHDTFLALGYLWPDSESSMAAQDT